VIAGTDFAASVGGGLDVRVNDSLKASSFSDGLGTSFSQGSNRRGPGIQRHHRAATLNGQRQDNWRFSVGLAF
jgi:hypothetical protein